MKAKLDEMDVALNTVIRVPRNTGLEQHRNLTLRPRLASYPAVRNIPFGVRGRRNQRRQTIMFIGVLPNPDNVQMSPIQETTPQVRPEPWAPARLSTPARRVYRRLTFTPSPDQNVLAAEAIAEDSLVDFSFTENFGNLSLDSN